MPICRACRKGEVYLVVTVRHFYEFTETRYRKTSEQFIERSFVLECSTCKRKGVETGYRFEEEQNTIYPTKIQERLGI